VRGVITPIVIWSLVAAPALFALFRAPRVAFLGLAGFIGVCGVTAWILSAGFGYGIAENMTYSLDGHVYLFKKGESFVKGDLVAFRWRGGATYPRGTTFIKQVVGVPGDVVRREGQEFWVGDRYVGIAKTVSKAGTHLAAAESGMVKPGEYFVATSSPDSLDSRYALTGNVKAYEVIGKAYVLF